MYLPIVGNPGAVYPVKTPRTWIKNTHCTVSGLHLKIRQFTAQILLRKLGKIRFKNDENTPQISALRPGPHCHFVTELRGCHMWLYNFPLCRVEFKNSFFCFGCWEAKKIIQHDLLFNLGQYLSRFSKHSIKLTINHSPTALNNLLK